MLLTFLISVQGFATALPQGDFRVYKNDFICVYGVIDSLDFSEEYPNLKELFFLPTSDLCCLFANVNHDMGISKNVHLKKITCAIGPGYGLDNLLCHAYLPSVISFEFCESNQYPVTSWEFLFNLPCLNKIIHRYNFPSIQFLQLAAKLPSLKEVWLEVGYFFEVPESYLRELGCLQQLNRMKIFGHLSGRADMIKMEKSLQPLRLLLPDTIISIEFDDTPLPTLGP